MNDIYYLSTNCCFNRKTRCITDINQNPIHNLTKLQFEVLDYLIINQGNTLTYDTIIQKVWDTEFSADNKNLMDIISQLRQIDDSLRECIRTVRGVGMTFVCDYNPPVNTSENDIHIVSCGQMKSLGYNSIGIATQLMINDHELFGDIGENQGDAILWAKFIEAYPETFHCALNKNNIIVGNWSFCAPKEEIIELIKNGKVKESAFNLNNQNYINFPCEQGYYDGFVLNFSLTNAYRTASNEHLLFNSFARQLLDWSNLGIYFRYIYVNVFAEEQKSMYENLGFVYCCPNLPQGTIYKLDLMNFPHNYTWNQHKELQKSYIEYFNKQ